MSNGKKYRTNNAIKYSSVGVEFLVLLLLGAWGGLNLDKNFITKPLFIILLSLSGLGIGMYRLLKTLQQDQKEK